MATTAERILRHRPPQGVHRARVAQGRAPATIIINGRPLDEYFGRETSKMILNQPLQLARADRQGGHHRERRGGGLSGQAGAIRHGISRALCAC